MKLQDLLTQLFTEGSNIVTTDWLVTGEATVSRQADPHARR